MVELANIKSPSKGRWDGTIARAIPSCADVASLLACAFVKSASVATMPIVVEHPFHGRIERFVAQWPIAFEDDLTRIPTVGSIDFSCGIQLTGEELHSAIDACEIVNNGIYKLDFNEGDEVSRPKFIISSEQTISSYREEVAFSNVIGEGATVLFSGPMHKFFGKKEVVNIFLGDDQPIVTVSYTHLRAHET